MAKATLPTNFKDDIMNASMNGKRKYRMIQNTDGTVSFEDVTTYDQVGSNFGAGQINATNTAVNASADASKIIDSLDAIAANTQKGYMAGALAVNQLNNNLTFPDGKNFYPDIQNGERGYNTDPARGADTFCPFSNIKKISLKTSVKAHSFGNIDNAENIILDNLEPGKTYICFITCYSDDISKLNIKALEWSIEAPHTDTVNGQTITSVAGIFKSTQASYNLGIVPQYHNTTIILWKIN